MKASLGFTLINALMALLVFTFGMLALASAYLKASVSQNDNEYFTQAGILAESMRSILMVSPRLLPEMNGFNSQIPQDNPELAHWVRQLKAALPPGVTAITQPEPTDVVCVATSACTLKLTISWVSKNNHNPSQDFFIQIGY
jgi:Tfp pilus assembly protein PilV